MSTELQKNASRINGAKSHGPATPEGKLISSTNALKHGLLAKAVVVDGESADRLAALSARFHAEFRPRTESETHYLETMIMCRWRLHRVWELESASLNYEIQKLAEAVDKLNCRTRAALAFRHLADNSHCFDLMNRYETRFARAFIRAHQCLMILKTQPLPDWHDHIEQSTRTIDAAAETDAESQNLPNEPEPGSNPVL